MTALLLFLAYTASCVILIHKTRNLLLELGAFFFTFMILSLWICVKRYRLLDLYLPQAFDEVTSANGEVVLLLDAHEKVINMNERMKGVLQGRSIGRCHFASLLTDPGRSGNRLDGRPGEGNPVSVGRPFLTTLKDRDITLECRCTPIRDRFNDPLGYLIVGREVRGLARLRAEFGITGREKEVLEKILSGRSNREIASSLGITDNTVKRHITNIYNKMGVGNKVQLLNLLRQYEPPRAPGKALLAERPTAP